MDDTPSTTQRQQPQQHPPLPQQSQEEQRRLQEEQRRDSAAAPTESRPPIIGNGAQETGDLTFSERLKRLVIGPPRDLADSQLFHNLSIAAFLAWVGLGADGLSSSSYGPEEAFRTLGAHTYLAIALAVVMATTVGVISVAYSRVIEEFPRGGGGYVVASKLLGEKAGVISGSALIVDYVLTITISIAAAGDALFSFVPFEWHVWKIPVEIALILLLTILNLRGVRESVMALVPVFLLFVVTHAILITVGIAVKAPELSATMTEARDGFSSGLSTLGLAGMLLLFIHAYSLGGGTYTGIEAVSNGLSIMREPRVQTGKRTMLYMAVSLAFTAAGLLLCYLLWDVAWVQGKTMNAVLVERFVAEVPLGAVFVILTLVSEGAILVAAAQAGFVAAPRVMATMANDSWLPRRLASLSDRLTTQNGIVLMGLASLAALLYTAGDVRRIVIMYSINVFLTFSMTELSMCKLWVGRRAGRRDWMKKISIHVVGTAMCLTILIVTIFEKFLEGGWLTLAVTGAVIMLCFRVRRHYRNTNARAAALYAMLEKVPKAPNAVAPPLDPTKPTAVILVNGFGGLGIHAALGAVRAFPNQFRNMVFVSVGVIDSGAFKGEDMMDELRLRCETALIQYVDMMNGQGMAAAYRFAIGTDAVEELERVCLEVAAEYPRVTYFAGQLVFPRERWYHRLLHNQTVFAVQRRLQHAGHTMVILPARVKDGPPAKAAR